MARDPDSSTPAHSIGSAPDRPADRVGLDKGSGASFISFCGGCGKPRSPAVAKCLFCGNTDPVAPPVQPSEIADRYAALLKSSDEARAAEARLGKLPDDLRERFMREAVADPSRIEEISAALLGAARERLDPSAAPELDALYQKLEPYGADAQAQFRRVLGLLNGRVDAAKVFACIVEDRAARARAPLKAARQIGETLAFPQRAAMAQWGQSLAAIVRLTWQTRWAPWVAVAAGVIAISSSIVRLAEPPAATADRAPRRALADLQRPIAQEVALQRAPATERKVEAEPATPKAVEATFTRATAEDTSRREAEAARGREEQQAARSPEAPKPEAEIAKEVDKAEPEVPQETEKAKVEPQEAARAEVAVSQGAGKAEAEVPQDAGKAEAALRLSNHDRMLVQAALTALGDEVPTTAYFGPITRAAISAWQKKRGLPETGFLDRSQLAALHAQAASMERKVEPMTSAARQSEAALNLSNHDRMLVQAELTALGEEVPTTAYFGPITRAAISAWQKRQGLPETGFLDRSQFAALQAQAATAERKVEQKADAGHVEAAMNLSDQDRKRVQATLTLLGHDVSVTGYFGPDTRAMIAAWQKTQGLPETGYLSDAQLATLRHQAAATLAKQDAAQSQAKDQRASR